MGMQRKYYKRKNNEDGLTTFHNHKVSWDFKNLLFLIFVSSSISVTFSASWSNIIGSLDDDTFIDRHHRRPRDKDGIEGNEAYDRCIGGEIIGGITSNRVDVSFSYQLVHDVGENAEDDLIPAVEKAISESLAVQFLSMCQTNLDQDTGRALSTIPNTRRDRVYHRLLDVLGVSSSPEDISSPNGCDKVDPGTECLIVNGGLSLYIDENSVKTKEEVGNKALIVIKDGMRRGKYLSDGIIKLTFRGQKLSSEFQNQSFSVTRIVSTSARGKALGYAVIGGVTVGLIFFGLLMKDNRDMDLEDKSLREKDTATKESEQPYPDATDSKLLMQESVRRDPPQSVLDVTAPISESDGSSYHSGLRNPKSNESAGLLGQMSVGESTAEEHMDFFGLKTLVFQDVQRSSRSNST